MHKQFKKDFKDKKVLILGLGTLGRGLGDAMYFARAGARVRVTDLKTAKELKPSLAKLKRFKNVSYSLGGNNLSDIAWAEVIVKNPGVRLDAPVLLEAKKLGKRIVMDDSLFAQYFKGTIIGVTGSKGKTTTTKIIYHILKQAQRDVFLGGNIRGLATLPLLDKVKANSVVVLELSSWQLQGFGLNKTSPQVSVVTSIFPDHQDYYGSMAKYLQDKSYIGRFQTKADYLLLNSSDKFHKKFAHWAKFSHKLYYNQLRLPSFKSKLLGQHNLLNMTAAAAVAKVFKVKLPVIMKALASFEPEPMHLEMISRGSGRYWFNDSTATIPDASSASVKAVADWQSGQHKIILIAGGFDKKLGFKKWVETIKANKCLPILLAGSGTEKLRKFLPQALIVNSMVEAVKLALKSSQVGDSVLLSPGLSSFGMFKNEYDRGDQFNQAVKKYARKK